MAFSDDHCHRLGKRLKKYQIMQEVFHGLIDVGQGRAGGIVEPGAIRRRTDRRIQCIDEVVDRLEDRLVAARLHREAIAARRLSADADRAAVEAD